MSDTAQISGIVIMVFLIANSFYWVVKKDTAATIWFMGIAIIFALMLF